jgi:hypothetical protein
MASPTKYDVVIDRGQVRKRRKKVSKKFRDTFGHTPLSIEEEMPWKCRRLVVVWSEYWILVLRGRLRR